MLGILKVLGGIGGLGFLLAWLAYRLIKDEKKKRIVLACIFMLFSLAILVIVGHFGQTAPLSLDDK